ERGEGPRETRSPIKHLIVIIGENRTFDHIFGMYQPKPGQTIWNLLSRGIVNVDGTAGPNFDQARQFTVSSQSTYYIDANPKDKTPYTILPPPTLGGAPNVQSDPRLPPSATNPGVPPFVVSFLPTLTVLEPDLKVTDLILLTTGATGATSRTGPDGRITNAAHLPNGPF